MYASVARVGDRKSPIAEPPGQTHRGVEHRQHPQDRDQTEADSEPPRGEQDAGGLVVPRTERVEVVGPPERPQRRRWIEEQSGPVRDACCVGAGGGG